MYERACISVEAHRADADGATFRPAKFGVDGRYSYGAPITLSGPWIFADRSGSSVRTCVRALVDKQSRYRGETQPMTLIRTVEHTTGEESEESEHPYAR